MNRQDTFETICRLFRDLNKSAQVETMAVLYYAMSDGQKDEFLRETENA